ncbi:MFS transporter [Chitinophaga pinensis]|uniref:Sugar (Glycoside-Pentoside-Hexuronide) transporter n=1 Tax=Chitinophaga pinensis (strain ATCC 43595 / DSM 2588 / LMG 13176 / NBRC 15968 / NCIMB 11800 / UQM 2034) TaxID=485918 RepID=A0A979G8W9_CHIPD|nr:MFS transporter [Chitinophaga pinensis]ACU62828.1 sugar (Glycoside-Pentoside-Hexuronide) transporter [Chitinophaga pinensis DSM 2588]
MSAPISLKEKVGYGFGDMASSMFWKLFGMYLLFFYTDVMKLDAAAIGTMFLITRVWDTLFDPFVGIITDRTQSRWGKFRPYLLMMALPFAIAGTLTFYTPSFAGGGRLVYAYVTYSLMMMIYSLINVPYASLLGVISNDGRERNTLASFRMSFAFAGSFMALGLLEPLVQYFTPYGLSAAWVFAVSIIAVICLLLFLLCFAWVKERVQPIQQQSGRLKDDFADLLHNKPWWILLGAGIAALIFNSIRDGATVYYFKYYITQNQAFNVAGIPFTYSTLYLLTGQLANIIGVILASPVANRLGKKRTYLLAMVLATTGSCCFYFLQKEQLTGIFVLQALISTCAGIIFPLLWSMYADIADYSEWKTGRRATGLVFSSSSMSQKFGWTIGGALTGWLLGVFNFQADTTLDTTAQTGIISMLSLIPAIGSLLSVVFIAAYPLSENKMNEISRELDIRRKTTATSQHAETGTFTGA